MPFLAYLHKAADRENLSAVEAETLMELILGGEISTARIASFLVALRMKGETPEEILGFARAMRARAVKIAPGISGEPLLDTCGTGGDNSCTFNISTVAAIVSAGAGVKVAKHGNRSLSSLCGSADILEGLGVNIMLSPEQIGECIRETGIGFMFAPAIHPAMKSAQQARQELKMRTAFNLLGPLTNPAGATVQVVGALSVRAAELIAQTLASLGLSRGYVVHGRDGLDEITTTGETLVLEIRSGAIAHHVVTPADFGVSQAKPEDLKGADLAANCAIARAVLDGAKGPARDIVLVNSSAALVACGAAPDFKAGVALAAHSLDSGAARRTLLRLVRFTQQATAEAVRAS
jgi:anthranilate phosphoribosyltransferase